MPLTVEQVTLAIILGTLVAIVFSLRLLLIVERRISRIDLNIQKLVNRLFREEQTIEKEQQKIERMLKR